MRGIITRHIKFSSVTKVDQVIKDLLLIVMHSHFTYNPNTQDFTVGNLNGNGSNVTDIHGPNITTGVIDVDRLPDATTSIRVYLNYNDISTHKYINHSR